MTYLLGVVTSPIVIALALGISTALSTGLEISCVYCGYSTGSRKSTRRITAWARWHWHKSTTRHHTRRWNRAANRKAAS